MTKNDLESKWYFRLIQVAYYLSLLVAGVISYLLAISLGSHFDRVLQESVKDLNEVVGYLILFTIIIAVIWYSAKWIFYYVITGEKGNPLDYFRN